MYAFIRGRVCDLLPNQVIVEAAGIGWRIFVPASTVSKLPAVGEECFLHTSHVVRENLETLYGFLSVAERELFEKLLGVNSVGPKLALSIIGHFELSELVIAFARRDVARLAQIPGIGKKTAERLCVEIRDRIAEMGPAPTAAIPAQDALAALVNLGYTEGIARDALRNCLEQEGEISDLPQLITKTLEYI